MKTTVYSWRVSAERKAALEHLARKQNRSVAELLDEAVGAWLKQQAANDGPDEAEERLRRVARRAIGAIAGGDPQRAERASERVREKLQRKRGNRSH